MAGKGNAAYDFSRFEDKKPEKAEIVELEPRLEAPKPRKTFRHILRAFAVFTVIAALAGPLIYNEMQMNELNMKVSSVQRKLNEAQSEYIQIEMNAESRVTAEDAEQYAVNVLGMKKLQPEQIIYIRVNDADKIEVNSNTPKGLWGDIADWFANIFS